MATTKQTSDNKKEENIYTKAAKDFGFKSEEELKAKLGEKLSPSDIEALSKHANLQTDNSLFFYTLLLAMLNPPITPTPLPSPIYISFYNTEPKGCSCVEK